MLNLPGETWLPFAVWMAFVCGRGHSRFNTPGDREDVAAAANAARRA